MTGHLRVPGPTGMSAGPGAGRIPGSLGLGAGAGAPPSPSASSPKLLPMPNPAGDGKTKVASDMTWKLFPGKVALGDVQQQTLLDCTVGALLAAHAHTETGRKKIRGMLDEHGGTVETDLSHLPDDVQIAVDKKDKPGAEAKNGEPARPKKRASSRYFTVRLGAKSVEVSPLLYTDESRDPEPVYMSSPTNALWPCLVEKAYAQMLGDYAKLNSPNDKNANTIWEEVTGLAPNAFKVADATDAEILGAAKRANHVPTIAASIMGTTTESDLQGFHGFVLLGLAEKKLRVYDASKLTTTSLAVEQFRANFTVVLSSAA